MKPLNLQNRDISPEECTPMTFFATSKFGLLQSSHKQLDERYTSDEIYSPATESLILSPDPVGNIVTKPYENTSGEDDVIEEDIYFYGRMINCTLEYIT